MKTRIEMYKNEMKASQRYLIISLSTEIKLTRAAVRDYAIERSEREMNKGT